MSKLSRRLRSCPSAVFGSGVSEGRISEIEGLVGVPIRGGFRNLLREFGWVQFFGCELFGIGAEDCADLVSNTRWERTESGLPLPTHLLPVMNNGAGDLYCLDTSVAPEPPVVGWWHADGADQVPTHEAADFDAWLHALLDEVGD